MVKLMKDVLGRFPLKMPIIFRIIREGSGGYVATHGVVLSIYGSTVFYFFLDNKMMLIPRF